jgi:hypothetical protein
MQVGSLLLSSLIEALGPSGLCLLLALSSLTAAVLAVAWYPTTLSDFDADGQLGLLRKSNKVRPSTPPSVSNKVGGRTPNLV